MSDEEVRGALREASAQGQTELLNTLLEFMECLSDTDLSLLEHLVLARVSERVEQIGKEIHEGHPRWLTPNATRHLVSDATIFHDERRKVLHIHAMCSPRKSWRMPLGDLAPMLEDGDRKRNARICQKCYTLLSAVRKAEGLDQG